VDGFAKTAMDHDARGADVTILAQLEYDKESRAGDPIPGAMERSVMMVLRDLDCDRAGYVPREGDLVTRQAFLGADATADRLYITSAMKHVEGQGWLCSLADKAPMRRS
jgi:hypothetical protein